MRRRLACLAALAAATLLPGCASPPRSAPLDAVNGPWAGRLALQVEDKPGESFSAGFELKGSAQAGELSLFSPLGGTLALLSWQPGSALLRANGADRQFDSVDALLAHVTGAAIPVAALFDWLRGIDTTVAGWRADLSQLTQGRLAARRLAPVPAADLRVVLER
ncbi:MAG TPA: outer membrane lipoprotein LolB [Ramlibacter sp.]|nr:outer membrane lipoprotein LolB [Ramlibacter sp.]